MPHVTVNIPPEAALVTWSRPDGPQVKVTMPDMDKVMTSPEFARFSGVSISTAKRMLRTLVKHGKAHITHKFVEDRWGNQTTRLAYRIEDEA